MGQIVVKRAQFRAKPIGSSLVPLTAKRGASAGAVQGWAGGEHVIPSRSAGSWIVQSLSHSALAAFGGIRGSWHTEPEADAGVRSFARLIASRATDESEGEGKAAAASARLGPSARVLVGHRARSRPVSSMFLSVVLRRLGPALCNGVVETTQDCARTAGRCACSFGSSARECRLLPTLLAASSPALA
jgi:hypothetical protein